MSLNKNEISGRYPILAGGEITLMYRKNSLYRAIEKDLIGILNHLGYVVECLRLNEHADSQVIREKARRIVCKDSSHALVLPDHTCWQAIQNHREFEHLRFPFDHLDTLTSSAAIKSLFARLSSPPAPGAHMNSMIDDTSEAITTLIAMIGSKNRSLKECHIIQNGLGEHQPYLFTLLTALAQAKAPDIFPPDRANPVTKLACDQVEELIATKIAEAVQTAGIRASLHKDRIITTIAADDVVICDLHYWKKHRSGLPPNKTLTLPLASMIAQACEHDLLASEALGDLVFHLDAELCTRHQKLAEAA